MKKIGLEFLANKGLDVNDGNRAQVRSVSHLSMYCMLNSSSSQVFFYSINTIIKLIFCILYYRMGFHWPPFNSISHLHMHVIYPISSMSYISRAVFKSGTFWFVEVRDQSLLFV